MQTATRIAAIIVLSCIPTGAALGQFWYDSHGKVPLKIDSSRVMIKFHVGVSLAEQQTIISSVDRIVAPLDDPLMIDSFWSYSLSHIDQHAAFIDSLRENDGIYLVEPYYLDKNDSPMLVGDGFCVAFRPGISQSRIAEINKLHGAVIDWEIMTNAYVIRNTDSSDYGLVELANAYHLLRETEFAHPDFSVRFSLFSYKLYDYYHPYQPHTKMVIGSFDSATVWDFAGLTNPIVVAVVDDGIEPHEDLPMARILEYGWNLTGPSKNPGAGSAPEAHGMASAGIIAASHTTDSSLAGDSTTGIISLNPHARIMNIRIIEDGAVRISELAGAITYAWQNGADVLSNSWGTYDTTADWPAFNLALDSAYALGRGGKGCPLIFASGNGAVDYPRRVAYPAKYDKCFAVGAVNLYETWWFWSQWGPELDVVAPSEWDCLKGSVWSLDRMWWSGYNPNLEELCGSPITWDCNGPGSSNNINYNCKFGGTSAAAPIVSGVASLLLSRDSMLTVDEVYDIIRYSADTRLEDDQLQINPPDTLYGYGRVDAFRAILSIARGDVDNNGTVDVGDLTEMTRLFFIVLEDAFPSPLLADCDCSGDMDIGDVTVLINHLYVTLEPLPIPCYEFGD